MAIFIGDAPDGTTISLDATQSFRVDAFSAVTIVHRATGATTGGLPFPVRANSHAAPVLSGRDIFIPANTSLFGNFV